MNERINHIQHIRISGVICMDWGRFWVLFCFVLLNAQVLSLLLFYYYYFVCMQEWRDQGYFQVQIHFENLRVLEGCFSIVKVSLFFVDEVNYIYEESGGYKQDESSLWKYLVRAYSLVSHGLWKTDGMGDTVIERGLALWCSWLKGYSFWDRFWREDCVT